jgi:glycosyltransferase involved in cell wall biosynthesis
MESNRAKAEKPNCFHLLVTANGLSRLFTRILMRLQGLQVADAGDHQFCTGSICVYGFGPVIFKKSFLESAAEKLNHGDFDFGYSSFQKLTFSFKKLRVLQFPPIWSKNRFLQINYLGTVVFGTFNRTNSIKSYSDFVELLIESKVQNFKQIGYSSFSDNRAKIAALHSFAIKNILREKSPKAEIQIAERNKIEISYKNQAPPLISVVVPTRGTKAQKDDKTLVENLTRSICSQNLENTNVELVIVYDTEVNIDYLGDIASTNENVSINKVPYDLSFNFSKKSNLGALKATGEVIVFLNDDIEFISKNALLELAGTAMIPDVGAVGAKLYFENSSVQHAGIVVIGGNVGHAYFKQLNPVGNFGDLEVIHEVSGVTGACFTQKRSVWEKSGGWDETFENSYNDVEYCFRLRDMDYCILQNNQIELFHFESLTRDPTFSPATKNMLDKKWSNFLSDDQYFPQYVLSQKGKIRFKSIIKKILKKLRIKR